tara:strand:- start:406 stop:2556 length:2151 start_codon:yes stop_codon:yes gene_type:complete
LAHYHLTGAQAGVDYFFNFGPLGWLYGDQFQPDLYPAKVTWGLALGVAFSLAVLWTASKLTFLRQRALVVALAVLVPDLGSDAAPLFLIYVVGLVALARPSRARFLLIPILLGILSLIKFTWFMGAGVAYAASLLCLVQARRWAFASLWLGWLLLIGVSLWLFLGQELSAWPAYLEGSLLLAQGHSVGMSWPGDSGVDLGLALATGGVVLAALVRLRALGLRELPALALTCGVLLLNLKHGIVRPDGGHALGSLGFCCLAAAAQARSLPALPRRHRRATALLVSLSMAIAVGGLTRFASAYSLPAPSSWPKQCLARLSHNLGALWSPGERLRSLEAKLAREREKHALLRVRAAVGSDPIDVLSAELGLIFLNDLTWSPRPVLQGYLAYGPSLAKRNATHFAGENAPPWLLLDGRAIDRHVPTLDDGAALIEAWRRYDFALWDRSYPLLRRRSQALAPRELVLDRELQLGEELELPKSESPLAVEIDLSPSLAGKVRQTLYRGALLHLAAELEGGEVFWGRLTPGAAQAGFLIDPLPRSRTQLGALFAGAEGAARVRSFRVVVWPQHRRYFEGTCRVRLLRLAARTKGPGREYWEGSALGAPWRSSEGSRAPEEALRGGVAVLAVQAPSVIEVQVPQGVKRVSGHYGLSPGQRSGAVEFAIDVDGVRAWERSAGTQARSGPQEFRLELTPAARRLRLSLTSADPSASGFWSRLQFER